MPQLSWAAWQGVDIKGRVAKDLPGPGGGRVFVPPENHEADVDDSIIAQDSAVRIAADADVDTLAIRSPEAPTDSPNLMFSWTEVTAPTTRAHKSAQKGAKVAFTDRQTNASLSSHMAKWLDKLGKSMGRYRSYKHVVAPMPSHQQVAPSMRPLEEGMSVGEFVRQQRAAGHGFHTEPESEVRALACFANSDIENTTTSQPPLLQLEDAEPVVNDAEPWENTPEAALELHLAVQFADPARLRVLMQQRNVHPDLLNEYHETPTLCAARSGEAACVAALLNGRADPLARDTTNRRFGDGIWPDERSPNFHGSGLMAKLSDVTDELFTRQETGRTAVYWMRLTKIFDEVYELLEPMTRIYLVRTMGNALYEWHGKSPLRVAAKEGNSRLASVLLANSAAIPAVSAASGSPDASPWTTQASWQRGSPWIPSQEERVDALHDALANNQWGTAEALLARGAPRTHLDNKRLRHGMAALHIVAHYGRPEVVKAILECRASPLIFNDYGRQPLHEACSKGHAGAVKALLDNDADPNVRVSERISTWPSEVGKTPLELAKLRGHGHLSTYFLESEVLPESAMRSTMRDTGRLSDRNSAWTGRPVSKGK